MFKFLFASRVSVPTILLLVEIESLPAICELWESFGYSCFIILFQDLLCLPLGHFALCMPKAQGQTYADFWNSSLQDCWVLFGFLLSQPLRRYFHGLKLSNGAHFISFPYLKSHCATLPPVWFQKVPNVLFNFEDVVILRPTRSQKQNVSP